MVVVEWFVLICFGCACFAGCVLEKYFGIVVVVSTCCCRRFARTFRFNRFEFGPLPYGALSMSLGQGDRPSAVSLWTIAVFRTRLDLDNSAVWIDYFRIFVSLTRSANSFD